MSHSRSLSRRQFLRLTGLSAGALLLAACSKTQSPAARDSSQPPAATASDSSHSPANGAQDVSHSPTGDSPASTLPPADVSIELNAAPARVNLLTGAATRVWQYQGQVTQGETSALQAIPDSYLGPILRLQRGQTLKVQFRNNIPDPSIIHWHGMRVPHEMDGHPHSVIAQGQSCDYQFRILNRAGVYWYHPHPHGRTGPQAYYGLAGMLIVSDEEEAALGLPAGEFDLPLVIQDRSFDAQNQWVYAPDTMNGFFGDQIVVNGQSQRVWNLQARPYRLRLLNGSNARIYRLTWDDQTPLTVIGSDGGLLEKPVQRPFITLAPGERVELWADFSRCSAGQQLTLKSLPFNVSSGGMGGMMGSGSRLPNGAALDILRIQIESAGDAAQPSLPEKLSTPAFEDAQQAVNRGKPRQFTLTMHMVGAINGRSFVMDEVAADEIVRLGDLEIWEFYNNPNGGMMSGGFPHPMHIHGVQFQTIQRQIDPQYQSEYEIIRPGLLDEGWKDTVLVWPGERVQVLARFADFAGLYLYHCHNLEHEDGGMMRNYRVES